MLFPFEIVCSCPPRIQASVKGSVLNGAAEKKVESWECRVQNPQSHLATFRKPALLQPLTTKTAGRQ